MAIRVLVQHTSGAIRRQTKNEVIELINLYEQDMDSLLIIEVDFSIEEAERLHKIDQYRKLLRALGIIDFEEQLRALRRRAINWIYQDFEASKMMREFAKRIENLIQVAEIRSTSEDFKLANIEVVQNKTGKIRGNLYIKDRNRTYGKGIVMVHGIDADKNSEDVLSRRLANIGFLVYSFDLPGHGESTEEFNLALACEYVFDAVRYLRQLGCIKVGAVGHSAGATACVFAALSYDREIENKVYSLMEEYLKLVEKLGQERFLRTQDKSPLDELYLRIKSEIKASLMRRRFHSGIIDAFALVSLEKSFQSAVPVPVLKLSKRLPLWLVKKLMSLEVVDDIPKPVKKKLKVIDRDKFTDYVIGMKGPIDYISLLDYFSKESPLVEGILNKIFRKAPKLLIFAGLDVLLRNFTSKSRKRYVELFSKLGNVVPSLHPWQGHFFAGYRFFTMKQQVLKPRVTEEIMGFLANNL